MTSALLLLAVAAAARDASYGRVDGDVSAVFGLGVAVGPRGASGAVDLRARYLDSAGVFVTYEEGFGGPAEPARALAFGVELRPLFLARWLSDLELGVPHLDLLIDSLGLELGAAILQPRAGDFGDRVALQAGLGLELPILGRARGPWVGLHGGVRLSDKGLAREAPSALERAAYLGVTLAWHEVLRAHVVDAGEVRR